MENNPFSSSSFEAPDGDSDKPDKETKKDKKKSAAKRLVSQDVSPPIESDSLSLQPKADKQAEAAPEKPESLEELSSEEVAHIQQETAQEHLEAIASSDEQVAAELEPATAFLERVADGVDPDEAFAEVAAEEGASETEIAEFLEELTEDDIEAEPADIPEFDTDADGIIDPIEQHEGVVDWRSIPSITPSMPTPTPPAPVSPAAPNTMPAAATEYYKKRYDAGDLLLIGFVGYLIGRRRGRVRAEKRLLPVQKKLEKKVTALEDDITRKEQQLVAIRAEKHPAEVKPIMPRAERPQPGRTETRIGLEKPARAEQLGHMIITAEAPAKAAPVEKSSKLRESFNAEQVSDMPRAELLEVSDKIIVEGASLRKIYESNLIGEKQLRHLVREYLQGKDIHKDLRREMIEHEIDFERDPQLRDRVRSQLSSDSATGGLSEMLAKAGVINEQADRQLERYVQKETTRQEQQSRKTKRTRVLVDTGMITVIVLLAAAVAFLLLR